MLSSKKGLRSQWFTKSHAHWQPKTAISLTSQKGQNSIDQRRYCQQNEHAWCCYKTTVSRHPKMELISGGNISISITTWISYCHINKSNINSKKVKPVMYFLEQTFCHVFLRANSKHKGVLSIHIWHYRYTLSCHTSLRTWYTYTLLLITSHSLYSFYPDCVYLKYTQYTHFVSGLCCKSTSPTCVYVIATKYMNDIHKMVGGMMVKPFGSLIIRHLHIQLNNTHLESLSLRQIYVITSSTYRCP